MVSGMLGVYFEKFKEDEIGVLCIGGQVGYCLILGGITYIMSILDLYICQDNFFGKW